MNNNITLSFQEKIERAVRDFQLFDGCKKILAGLSGGADSTCLLLMLSGLSQKYGFELYAMHVNHMIRADEADRDEAFSKKLCQRLGVPFLCERVDVPDLAKKSGESLELCARNQRYNAFVKACLKLGITHVATAHNAGDNAETVVFNLVRGTGLKGLCGIPPKRELCEGVTVIRPLIYAERSEIEAYLSENNQDYVTDSTNNDSDYSRNYIRNEILPLMKKLNSSLVDGVAKTSFLLRSDEEYLSMQAEKCLTDDIESLSALHESLLSRVVMRMFCGCSDEILGAFHVKEVCRRIYEYDGKPTSVSLPDGLCARLYRGKISFVKDKRTANKPQDFETELVEGGVFFEENPYALYISFDQTDNIPKTLEKDGIVYKIYTTDCLYFDKIPHVLRIRNRRDGDKILSGKMNKSVKRLMNDSDFANDERYLVPFVCDGEKILLVPAVAVCDECRSAKGHTETLCVTLYRKP